MSVGSVSSSRHASFWMLLVIMPLVLLRAQHVEITFRVIVPSSTPPDSRVYIAGNDSILGLWDPGRISLRPENDSMWVGKFSIAVGTTLEYKVTRGAWNVQAIYEAGVIPENSRHNVDKDSTITIRPLMWSDEIESSDDGITGTVRYHRDLEGEGLQYDRDLIVWLPPSYETDQNRRYPVLYMHDGQNIIDPHTSFAGHDWRMDEVCDSLIRSHKMREIIVVGIYNSPERMSEYSSSPEGRAYARFVVGVVKPLIDSTYRTMPDRENTVVMGSSLGGLISFLFAWWYPDIFSKAACLSTVFSYNQDAALKEVEVDTMRSRNIKIYVDCGGVGGEATLKPGMDKMARLLTQKGYKEGVDFESYYDASAEHNELAWAARVWRPLLCFFGLSE